MSVFHEQRSLPTWRKVALSAWGAPRSPAAYGMLDIDCEPALAYIEKLRAASGEKITLTHVLGRAIALALTEHPEVNGFVSGGRLMLRDTVDVFFQVVYFDDDDAPNEPAGEKKKHKTKKDANLAGAKVRAADTKSTVEIARELRERATRLRARGDAETARGSATLAKFPAPLVGLATRAGGLLSYDFGLNLSRFGIPYDAFGSCMITNVGVFGITVAWAPLVEMSRVPLVLTLGAVRETPVARNGAVVVGRVATVGVAFDHRVMDGYHAGKMAHTVLQAMASPESALGA
jgi:pyruvate/2-oxoglutarate dehydrogenase complex dihydrolipoamide acyltransferase (E2) component